MNFLPVETVSSNGQGLPAVDKGIWDKIFSRFNLRRLILTHTVVNIRVN